MPLIEASLYDNYRTNHIRRHVINGGYASLSGNGGLDSASSCQPCFYFSGNPQYAMNKMIKSVKRLKDSKLF